MKLEAKQSQNIPLTESEKYELNYVKMEMMIFDIRYGELQEHGTLPNWFRFSLKERLTDEDVNKFIEDFAPWKAAASTICVLGAGKLTEEDEQLNGVERFHVKAVNKIVSKMERNSFIHVTTLEEGFEKCHELCKLHDLRIQEHYTQECYYCMKEEEAKNEQSDGTFRLFAGRFASLYERMGQRLKNFMFKNPLNFEVDDDEDSTDKLKFEAVNSYPDFDPWKSDQESETISNTTLNLVKISTKNIEKSDQNLTTGKSDIYKSSSLTISTTFKHI